MYERDGYRCHVCGGLTDPTAPWRLPRAPSLDHVVPWSEGGDDGPANLRCAHRGCNADRGVRGVSEQLWLFDPNWPELIHPHASAIDTDLPVPPESVHIMLGSKASWVEPAIHKGDETFDAYPKESLADWHARHGI